MALIDEGQSSSRRPPEPSSSEGTRYGAGASRWQRRPEGGFSALLLSVQSSSGYLSRPDRNVASIGSLRPVSGRGAVAKAVCADRLPGASSERARPRHRVGGHREADLLGQPRSSVGEPWITATFRIKLDPCGSSCKRSRKLAFPGRLVCRWEFVGTSEASDYVAACREVARLPGRYAAVEAQTVVIEQTTE